MLSNRKSRNYSYNTLEYILVAMLPVPPDEVLVGFSPYWRDHLNRFGTFTLDMDRNTTEINYDLVNAEI